MMSQWQVKAERFVFDYNKDVKDGDDALARLTQNITNMSVDGWEPWHQSGSVIELVEYVVVWFKRKVV